MSNMSIMYDSEVPKCMAYSCLNEPIDNYHCKNHACVVFGCSVEKGIYDQACKRHLCQFRDSECRRVKLHGSNFCEFHKCEDHSCNSVAVKGSLYCKAHICRYHVEHDEHRRVELWCYNSRLPASLFCAVHYLREVDPRHAQSNKYGETRCAYVHCGLASTCTLGNDKRSFVLCSQHKAMLSDSKESIHESYKAAEEYGKKIVTSDVDAAVWLFCVAAYGRQLVWKLFPRIYNYEHGTAVNVLIKIILEKHSCYVDVHDDMNECRECLHTEPVLSFSGDRFKILKYGTSSLCSWCYESKNTRETRSDAICFDVEKPALLSRGEREFNFLQRVHKHYETEEKEFQAE